MLSSSVIVATVRRSSAARTPAPAPVTTAAAQPASDTTSAISKPIIG
jgi:hypothetical protein